jgi:bacillithiol synthase
VNLAWYLEGHAQRFGSATGRRALWLSDWAVYYGQVMNAIPVSYKEAPKATPLFLDYVYRYDRVQKFYTGNPFEFASYEEVARRVNSQPKDRKPLLEILTRQNQSLDCSELTLANIRRLGEPGTLAVVTGQQVGLFSGPAFTLYKALTALRVSQYLTDHGLTCVPVFWLATEDHDLDEVGKTAVLDEAGELMQLSDPGITPVSRPSVGYVKLSPQVRLTLDRLEQALPAGEPRDSLMLDLRESYNEGAGWGQAFGRFMTRLFSRFGVIMIDPLSPQVHHAVSACYDRALREASSLRKLLQERSKELVGSGYHAQVHVADDSTLLFAAQDGNRAAIRQEGSEFYLERGKASAKASLEGWIASKPVDFSPSALLRPVIQDTLLPTVAYVAGPAELAYFGQAQVVYPEFGRSMPVIFPRAGFTLADQKLSRLLERYQIKLDEVWRGEEHLLRRIAAAAFGNDGRETAARRVGTANTVQRRPNHAGDSDPVEIDEGRATVSTGVANPPDAESWVARIERTEVTLKRLLDGLRQDVKPLDPTLVDAVRNGEEKILYQIDRLKGKISRAAVERSQILRRHEQDLFRFLAPAGNLQEREVSGIYFLARAGYELLDRLLPEIETTRAEHRLIVY